MIIWCPRLLARDSKETPRKPGLNDLNKNLREARCKTTATATFRVFWCSPFFAVCWHRCIPCFAPGPVKKRAGPRHYDG